MKFLPICFLALAVAAWAGPADWLEVETTVAAETAKHQTTVVHFWAPWCPNSQAEIQGGGWAKFINAHPGVEFVFVTVRSRDDGKAYLAAHGVGGQPNLRLLQHPNYVRKGEGSMQYFMDLPVSWIPTTWVFRAGRLRYALNYGEIHFPMLEQLLRDTENLWEHSAKSDAGKHDRAGAKTAAEVSQDSAEACPVAG